MKKFFIIALLVLFIIQIAVGIFSSHDLITPAEIFRNHLNVAYLSEYRNPIYGYKIKYPCFFQKDDSASNDSNGSVHLRYDVNKSIVLESYVAVAPSNNLDECAQTLAKQLHATPKFPFSQTKSISDSSRANSFTISSLAYENGHPADGYSRYAKYIKSGKTLFVYSIIYPEDYKKALSRMFQIIDNWTVVGAY